MTSERRKPYPFDVIEPKWQLRWEESCAFHASNPGEVGFDASKPKFYVLDMFPYPSGTGLHVGHPEGYTATDILARAKRMQGFNVLHPMGWDAFGLPAEQYAIKTGQHPAVTTAQNVENFKGQLKRIGFAYDWQREVNTTDPRYFRWTQWIFLQLYNSYFDPELQKAQPIALLEEALSEQPPEPESWKHNALLAEAHQSYLNTPSEERAGFRTTFLQRHRLAYVATAPVNWCPALGTVLANEEVVDGKSEIGGHPVERRPMRQWMLRITAYAERLINELTDLDWPDSIKALQRNWIGRSEGAMVEFAEAPEPWHAVQRDWEGETPQPLKFTVFTTRPDTLFGATYLVLAPEHPLVELITAPGYGPAVAEYRASIASKSDLERTELSKEKTGVFTGSFAINPVNNERIPIWIADYVLLGYGTGAIMAVPAHDERDWEFARNAKLPVKHVVAQRVADVATMTPISPSRESEHGWQHVRGTLSLGWQPHQCFTGDGIACNSSPLIDGLPTRDAKDRITSWLEQRGLGKRTINYKLRDWLFSRQRYWGEPFPIVWEGGDHRALSETELPVEPPELADFKPTGTGEPPLAKATDWVRYSETAQRETNTMPQWAGSCWYYLRYCDPQNADRFVSAEAERYWMRGPEGSAPQAGGVDLYVGGTEHAVLHLLYARFWHKVLFDLGHVSTPEPFHRLVNQGIILGEDGQKMSKSRGNVVNPDDVIAQYGADAFRCYEMFMGPLEQMKPWSMTGVEGVSRFLARVWRLMMTETQDGDWSVSPAVRDVALEKAQLKVLHATIKKVTQDVEVLSFNTAIAQMMIFVNAFTSAEVRPRSAMLTLLQLLNPFAPHFTEELWERLGAPGVLAQQRWPSFDEQFLIEDEVEIPVQVNGKLRDKIIVKKDAAVADYEAAALGCAKVQEHVAGKTIRKIVVVPGKLVNIVAS